MAEPRPQELKEWAASPEGQHFCKVLQTEVSEAKDNFAAGLFNKANAEETGMAVLRLQAQIETTERVISTLVEMAEWEPPKQEEKGYE